MFLFPSILLGKSGVVESTTADSTTITADSDIYTADMGVSNTPSAPVNAAPPIISGTAQSGQVLTTTNGIWSNNPTSFTYQWRANGSPILGAIDQTYTVMDPDIGKTLSVMVTATNDIGSTSKVSAETATVIGVTPIQAPEVTAEALSDTSIEFTYTPVADATSYQYRFYPATSAPSSTFITAPESPVTLTGLLAETEYRIEVRAVSTGGAGPWSTPASATTQPAPVLANQSLRFNKLSTHIRYNLGNSFAFPNANWTMGIWIRPGTDLTGSFAQYLISNGTYQAASAVNFLFYNSGSATPSAFELSVRDATNPVITVRGANNAALTANEWRLWIIERNKTTETLNIYWLSPNGTKNLYASGSSTGLGAFTSTTPMGLGTRVPPVDGSQRWFGGDIWRFFKMDGLLSDFEMTRLAAGQHLVTDIGKPALVHTTLNTLTTPIPDESGNNMGGMVNGPFALAEGPTFNGTVPLEPPPPQPTVFWEPTGPGTVTSTSVTALSITGTGTGATTGLRSFTVTPGRRYRLSWNTDSATGTYKISTKALKWSEPPMSNPQVIDLEAIRISNITATNKKTVWTFANDVDVIFDGTTLTQPWPHDRLQISGGRNIIIRGGHYKPTSYSSLAGTFNIVHNWGTVYIEGVHIDHSALPDPGYKDGMGYYVNASATRGPGVGDIYVQNSRIDDIRGIFEGPNHGDAFQPQGSIHGVYFYNVSVTTDYCAFQLEPRNSINYFIDKVHLERVDVQKINRGDPTSWLFYFTKSTTPNYAKGCTLIDVYTTETSTNPAHLKFLYPPATVPQGAVRTGDFISWPNKPYTGGITVGTPNFVSPSSIGLGYTPGSVMIKNPDTSFVNGANTYEFNATTNEVIIEFQRTSSGTVNISSVALTDIGAVEAPNMLLNNGWGTVGTATASSDGVLTLAATGTTVQARQGVNTVAGQTYRLTWTVTGQCAYCLIGTTASDSSIKGLTTCDGAGNYTHNFTATSGVTWVRYQRSTSGTSTVSNVKLVEV